MIEIVFLGTAGSMPTENRNLPAIAILYQGWVLLLDCGEDIQRQIERAGIGLNKKMSVFITHNHADHLLGLPGLLLRFSLLGRIKPLKVYGPKDLIEYVKVNQSTINLGTTFETIVYAVEPGVVFQEDNLIVNAFEVNHRGFALGYKIILEKQTGEFIPKRAENLGIPQGPLWGKLASGESIRLENGLEVHPEDVTGPRPRPLSIVYSGDTRPCDTLRDAASNANILICEAMYTTEHAHLAEERGHSTASDAAKIALDANVGLLVLTHYSPRYFDGSEILNEGKDIFSNTILARDLMRITIDKEGKCAVTESGIVPPSKNRV
jgi:ribonuclease Z